MGVTFGIILGVLVPILFLGVWGYFCYVKKSRPVEDGSTSWEYENNIVNRSLGRTPRALSPAKGSSSDSDRSSSGSISIFGGKRRSYDKVYRTKEPLPNKPLIEFEDKLWDLEEEGPESSLTTTDDTPSDLAKNTRALPGVGTSGNTGTVSESPSDLGSPSELGRTGNTVVNRRAKQTAI